MGTSLREVLTPLFSYALLLVRTPADLKRPSAEIRGEVDRLIQEQEAAIKRLGTPVEDYENARFAAVAWLDEMLLRHAYEVNPDLFAEWKRSPLQVALYNTANAGEEFFEQLDKLSTAQNEISEVYFLALSLGFRGRYYDDQQEPKLIELRHQLSQRLPTPAVDLFEIEKRQEQVTPQPYAVQPPVPKPIAPGVSPLWLAAPVALAVVALLYFLWPSGPDRKEVEKAVRSFECAEIKVDVIEGNTVKLSGHVESDQQNDLLRQKLLQVKGVKNVISSDLVIIPRPFCAVMDVLNPFVHPSDLAGGGVAIRPPKGCDVTYFKDELLTFDVVSQKPLHYVYTDYYKADREKVAHLFPLDEKQALDNSTVSLNVNPGSHGQWTVSEPFGREMVTVISSPKPLFSPFPSGVEPAENYLFSLRPSLQANRSDPGVSAAYCFITTEDR